MTLSLFNVSLCFCCVRKSHACVVVDFDEICTLLVHLAIDILSDGVDSRHERLDIVELVLPLVDYCIHERSFTLNLELFAIQFHYLLLLEQAVRFLIIAWGARLTVAVGLLSIHEVHMLLHLEKHFLLHFAKFGLDVSQAFLIGLLLLSLLLLALVRHADVAVFFNE